VTRHYPQKLALTSPTGGGRSVGIVRVRTKATEFLVYVLTESRPRACCSITVPGLAEAQLSSYSLPRVLSLGIGRYHTYKPLSSVIFLLKRKVKKENSGAITIEITHLFLSYLTT